MKRLISTIKKSAAVAAMSCFCFSLMAEQVVITVDFREEQTGNLEKALIKSGYDNPEKLAEITDLKILTEGKYVASNSREFDIALEISDFQFITNQLINLQNLDLSESTVTSNYGEGRGASNSLPKAAFKHNQSIKSILLPNTLVGMEGEVFQNTALEGEIIIPEKVNGAANFDYSRFGHSLGITGFIAAEESQKIATIDGVVFSKDLTELHYYPAGKTEESYTVPEGVTTIRNSAFEDNHFLKNLTLSSSVIISHQPGQENYGVWGSQSEIENVFVADGNEKFGSANGVLYTKDRNRVVWSPRGKKDFILPEPIKIIAGGGTQNSIFGGNGNTKVTGVEVSNNYTKVITMADFPATLDTIENGAFVSADSLEYIICRAENVPYTYKTTFRNVGSYHKWNTKVYVPAISLEAYQSSFWVDKTSRPIEGGGTETNEGGFQKNNFIAFYNIALTNATAQSSIATDIAPENDIVTITAKDRTAEGWIFTGWTVSENVVLVDENSLTTTFTMPAGDVEITANYEENTTTGIDTVSETQLAVYPNPAVSTIQLKGCSNEPYVIYSITGKTVAEGITSGEAISVAHFANGLYVVKAGDRVSRFIKE